MSAFFAELGTSGILQNMQFSILSGTLIVYVGFKLEGFLLRNYINEKDFTFFRCKSELSTAEEWDSAFTNTEMPDHND